MQRIERYGVIALVVLLVTILAVSLWGESGWSWKFWESKGAHAGDTASADSARQRRLDRARRGLDAQDPASLPGGTSLPQGRPIDVPIDPELRPAPGQGGAAQSDGTRNAGPIPIPSETPGGSGRLVHNDPPVIPDVDVRNQPPPVHPNVRVDPPAKPQQGARSYTVRSGDTLGEIAQRELGSASRWPEIQRLNGNVEPSKLRAGMTLALPAGGAVAKIAPASVRDEKPAPPRAPKGGSTYVVQSGDSLSVIAARELGSASRWTEIRDLNPGVDAAHLHVGTALQMPGSKAPAAPRSEKVARAENAPARVGWSPRSDRKTAVQ